MSSRHLLRRLGLPRLGQAPLSTLAARRPQQNGQRLWFCVVAGSAVSLGLASNTEWSSCFYSSDMTQTPECIQRTKAQQIGITEKKKWLEQRKENVICLEYETGFEAVQFLMTRLRDRSTPTERFVADVGRLSSFVAEIAFAKLHQHKHVTVTAADGSTFNGIDLDRSKPITCVSILRSGDSMLPAFVRAEPNVSTGKILITRYNNKGKATKDPKLYYSKLPRRMKEGSVLLLDPLILSGETIKVALNELTKEHGVEPSQVLVVTMVSCRRALENVLKAYPEVRIITVVLDEPSKKTGVLSPGLGSFGDRYFGYNS